jgi:hypothetical protein
MLELLFDRMYAERVEVVPVTRVDVEDQNPSVLDSVRLLRNKAQRYDWAESFCINAATSRVTAAGLALQQTISGQSTIIYIAHRHFPLV